MTSVDPRITNHRPAAREVARAAQTAQAPAVAAGPTTNSAQGLEIAAASAVAAASRAARAPADSLAARLYKRAAEMPNAPAYHVKVAGEWQTVGWAGYAEQVRNAARSLLALGLSKKDVGVIYSTNRPEWTHADLAMASVGIVSASAGADSTGEGVGHILDDSGAKILFVEDEPMWRAIADAVKARPSIEHVVVLNGAAIDHPKAISWESFNAKGAAISDALLTSAERQVKNDDTATLIYTSGTTGKPKGVMLSHKNLAFAGDTFSGFGKLTPDDRGVCYLRLSHIADRMFSVAGPVTSGMQVFYASAKTLKSDLLHIRPTILFGVPRIWDTLAGKIEEGLAAKTGVAGAAAKVFQDIGRKVTERRNHGGWAYKLGYLTANKLLFTPVKEAIGIENVRLAISGAAAMSPATADLFASLDLPLYNAYGQSEASGVVSTNSPGENVLGSLGKPAPGVTVRIADDGEILVRGDNVCKGYWNNPEATASTIQEGWLATGDVGRFDDAGNLFVIGRKKRAFKLENGEFINPEATEEKLRGGIIDEVVLVGSGRPVVGALIMLDPALVKKTRDPEIVAQVEERIKAVRGNTADTKIRCFYIVERPLTVGDDGEINGTGKLKPFVLEKNFAAQIDAMYAALKK